jgi:hypothetical protein
LHNIHIKYDCNFYVQEDGGLVIHYKHPTDKIKITDIHRDRYDSFVMLTRLTNIGLYSTSISSCSDNVKNIILNGKDCNRCSSKCKVGIISFNYGGLEYKKCGWFGCNFVFKNIHDEDINCIVYLLEQELNIKSKKPAPNKR